MNITQMLLIQIISGIIKISQVLRFIHFFMIFDPLDRCEKDFFTMLRGLVSCRTRQVFQRKYRNRNTYYIYLIYLDPWVPRDSAINKFPSELQCKLLEWNSITRSSRPGTDVTTTCGWPRILNIREKSERKKWLA